MEKIALRCDICNGALEMQAGGQFAVCEYCGTKYSLGRLRDKIQEIQGTVNVNGVVKAAKADFDIRSGVLEHYYGKDVKVIVPDGVHSIGSDCFRGMEYLESITLPDSLDSIQYRAFSGCFSLTQITLPERLTIIGNKAFELCFNLKRITIPDRVKGIGDYAFDNCTKLTHVSFPKGLKQIGERAFNNCASLTHISFNVGLEEIGESAFAGCIGLTCITLPNELKKLGDAAFLGCTALSTITLSENLMDNMSLYSGWFAGCDNLSTINGVSEALILKLIRKDSSYSGSYSSQISDCPLRRALFRRVGVCQYCGGELKGFFSSRCSNCRKERDY